MLIEYNCTNYAEQRNIIEKLKLLDIDSEYVYIERKRNDPVFVLRRIMATIKNNRKINWDAFNIYRPIRHARGGILHTFNQVCVVPNSRKYCVTFESTLPRTNYTVNRPWEINGNEEKPLDRFTMQQIERLSRPNCIAMIAISQCSYNIQKMFLNRYLKIDQIDSLLDKTYVVHPPQEVLTTIEQIENKYSQIDTIEMIFVGAGFFRKGGAELVEALSKLSGQYKFHLTVISRLEFDEYASHSSIEDKAKYADILANTNWITWYDSLPNFEVLELCKKAHVGFLPSLADTYGYSVLEMQACGCPVVTTNVRALPEINNENCGWIIPLCLRESGEAHIETKETSNQCRETIYNGLINIVIEICESPNILLTKAKNSFRRIQELHDPKEHARKLLNIYEKANS